MKIKNLSISPQSQSHVVASFDIIKDDGTLLLHVDNRAFVSTATTRAEAKAELKQSIRNIRDAYVAEKNSKLADAFNSLVGQETDIEA